MKPKYEILLQKNHNKKFSSRINTTHNKIIIKTMLLCLFLSITFVFVSEKTGWLEVNWNVIFIPALLVLQIIIISTALKNRYRKLWNKLLKFIFHHRVSSFEMHIFGTLNIAWKIFLVFLFYSLLSILFARLGFYHGILKTLENPKQNLISVLLPILFRNMIL